jgi:hypothetical protein
MAAHGSVRATPDGDVPVIDLGPQERMQVLTVQPGMVAYHGTFKPNVGRIAEDGICRMGRVAIHLFRSWQVCTDYVRRFDAVARVDLGACQELGIKFVVDLQGDILLTDGILGIIPISCVDNICQASCRTEFLLHSDHRDRNAIVYSQKLDALLDVRDLVAGDPDAYPQFKENPSIRSVFQMANALARERSRTDAENVEAVPCTGVSLDAGNRAVATALRAGANAGLSGDSLPVRVACLLGLMRDAQNSDAFVEGLQSFSVQLDWGHTR